MGDLKRAAQLVGFINAAYTSRQSGRRTNEARAHEATMAILNRAADEIDIDALLASGVALEPEVGNRLAES